MEPLSAAADWLRGILFSAQVASDAAGWAQMRILNRPLGIAVIVRYDTAVLPYLVHMEKAFTQRLHSRFGTDQCLVEWLRLRP